MKSAVGAKPDSQSHELAAMNRGVCGLEIRDTADWKSALQLIEERFGQEQIAWERNL